MLVNMLIHAFRHYLTASFMDRTIRFWGYIQWGLTVINAYSNHWRQRVLRTQISNRIQFYICKFAFFRYLF